VLLDLTQNRAGLAWVEVLDDRVRVVVLVRLGRGEIEPAPAGASDEGFLVFVTVVAIHIWA